MRKRLFVVFIFISLIIVSCKKTETDGSLASIQSTLRFSISNLTLTWEDEIEGDFFNAKAKSELGIKKNVALSPESYIVSTESRDKPVYPSIQGFGSLDTSDINGMARDVLNGFFAAVKADTDADSFVDARHIATLIFFLSDLKKVFSDNNGSFSLFFYGKPFITDVDFGVPVRLTEGGIFLDLLVYLNKDSDWMINQIQIKKRQEKVYAE